MQVYLKNWSALHAHVTLGLLSKPTEELSRIINGTIDSRNAVMDSGATLAPRGKPPRRVPYGPRVLGRVHRFMTDKRHTEKVSPKDKMGDS